MTDEKQTDAEGRPFERRVRRPALERADFESWALESGVAYRNHQGFWFYRNGGDGLYEAWLAGRNGAYEDAARRVVIHSQYPITTEFDRGYDKGRADAGKALRALKTPNVGAQRSRRLPPGAQG